MITTILSVVYHIVYIVFIMGIIALFAGMNITYLKEGWREYLKPEFSKFALKIQAIKRLKVRKGANERTSNDELLGRVPGRGFLQTRTVQVD